ncbi:MAG: methionyl-tRNA formyltransferase [Opitutales bacterium]
MTRGAPIRVAFMGSDAIALPMLRSLAQTVPEVELCGVFTQPDRPSGRGQKLRPNAIKSWALEQDLPVRQPDRCGPADEDWLREAGVELLLVMAFGQILKRSLLAIPARGTFNLHASLLPKLRGASPIHTALASGEEVTGVSFMRIVPQLDAGPFCAQETLPIGPSTTAPELIAAIAEASVPLVARALPAVIAGTARFEEQSPGAVTYCRRLFKEDAALDFHAPATALHRRIRAFQPWPGTVIDYRGTPLKIGAASVGDALDAVPGTLLVGEGTCRVACGAGSLLLEQLQRPGGRLLPVGEFLRGFPLEQGAVLPSVPLAPLVARRPFPWRWRPGDASAALEPIPPNR